MYILSLFPDIGHKINEAIFTLVRGLYSAIGFLFSVFDILARTRLFSSDIVSQLTNRTYLIISVVMMFVLTYSFITMIIDPDKASKGDKVGAGLIKRVVIGLVVLVITPSVFDFGYGLQESVIDNNTIGRLIIGGSDYNPLESTKGDFIVSLFQGGFYLTNTASDSAKIEYYDAVTMSKLSGNLDAFGDVFDYTSTGEVEYSALVSFVVACFAGYCLVIFCFDLGVRCAKLAFLEMITPLPALLYMVPGKEGTFKSWLKECLSTFAEVFIRVSIIYFITYAFSVISQAYENGSLLGELASTGSVTGLFVKLFVLLGLLVFALRAPKLICELLGIKSGNLMSFKNRWDEAKKAVGTAALPARKAVGMGAGIFQSQRAYREGIKMGVVKKGDAWKRVTSVFNGARNGWKSGFMGQGNAYNFEKEMQRSYALSSDKSGPEQWRTAVGDSLRDNFGFQSRYADDVRNAQTDRDLKAAYARQDLRTIDDAISARESEVNKQHYGTLAANKAIYDSAKKFNDRLSAVTSKENSLISSSNFEMCSERRSALDAAEKKARDSYSKGDLTLGELNSKLEQISSQRQFVNDAESYFMHENILDEQHNNFSLSKNLEKLYERDDLSQREKNALAYIYKNGKDLNNLHYLEQTPSTNWDSELKLDHAELHSAIKAHDAGFTVSSTGQRTTDRVDFTSMFEDPTKLVKIGKSASDLINKENLAIHEALNETPYEVQLNATQDTAPTQHNYSELKQIQSSQKTFVDDLNKSVEKAKEANEGLEQSYQARENARKAVKPPKHGGNR